LRDHQEIRRSQPASCLLAAAAAVGCLLTLSAVGLGTTLLLQKYGNIFIEYPNYYSV
jgi:hypothetical protein